MTGGQAVTRRATRFTLNLPLRYRVRGDRAWSYGMTMNISCSGVLLRTGSAPGLATDVELEVVLPGNDEASPRVIGHGSVTRVPDSGGGDDVIALSIEGYGLVRPARNEI